MLVRATFVRHLSVSSVSNYSLLLICHVQCSVVGKLQACDSSPKCFTRCDLGICVVWVALPEPECTFILMSCAAFKQWFWKALTGCWTLKLPGARLSKWEKNLCCNLRHAWIHFKVRPLPQMDIIGAMMIIWRVRGKLSGLFCAIVCATIVHSAMHTHEQT